MNNKIKKLLAERERNLKRIVGLRKRNKQIAEEVRQLEDIEIIGTIRANDVTIDELIRLLAARNKASEGASENDPAGKENKE